MHDEQQLAGFSQFIFSGNNTSFDCPPRLSAKQYRVMLHRANVLSNQMDSVWKTDELRIVPSTSRRDAIIRISHEYSLEISLQKWVAVAPFIRSAHAFLVRPETDLFFEISLLFNFCDGATCSISNSSISTERQSTRFESRQSNQPNCICRSE